MAIFLYHKIPIFYSQFYFAFWIFQIFFCCVEGIRNTTKPKSIGFRYSNHTFDKYIDECNLNGQNMRIAVIQQAPLVSCFQDYYGDWNCNGSNIEIIKIFEKRFNFKAEWLVLTESQANQDGQDDVNITLDSSKDNQIGVYNLLQNGRAWMSANGLMTPLERKFNLTLSEPFDNFRLHFLLSKTLRDHDHIFLKPFLPQTWLAIFISSLLIVPIFYVINRTSYHYLIQNNKFLRQIPTKNVIHFSWSKLRDKFNNFVDGHKMKLKRSYGQEKNLTKPEEPKQPVLRYRANSCSPSIFSINPSESPPVSLKSLTRFRSSSINLVDNHNEHQHSVVRRRVLSRPLWSCLQTINRAKTASSQKSSSSSSSYSSSLTTSFCEKIDQLLELGANFQIKSIDSRFKLAKRRRIREERNKFRLELRRARHLRRLDTKRTGFSSISYIVWYVVSSLAAQGGETEALPTASSTRILIAFWWFYLIVIISIHSGLLTAILTFPKQNDFIQTLEDFLELTDSYRMEMKVSVDQHSEIARLLSKEENYMRSRLQQLFNFGYNHFERIQGHTDLLRTHSNNERQIVFVDFKRHREKIIDEIQNGYLAHIEEKSFIDMTITREYFEQKQAKCLLKSSRFPIDVIPMSFLFGPKMPKVCVQKMNFLLVNIMEMGLASKWRRKYEVPNNDCLHTVIINAGDIKKIELRQVILSFWILLAGVAFGLVILVLEILWMITAEHDHHHNHQDIDRSSPSFLFYDVKASFLTDDEEDNIMATGRDSETDSNYSCDDYEFRLGYHQHSNKSPLRGRHPKRTFELGAGKNSLMPLSGLVSKENFNQLLNMAPTDIDIDEDEIIQDPAEWARKYRMSKLKARKRKNLSRSKLIEISLLEDKTYRQNNKSRKSHTPIKKSGGIMKKAGNLFRQLHKGEIYAKNALIA